MCDSAAADEQKRIRIRAAAVGIPLNGPAASGGGDQGPADLVQAVENLSIGAPDRRFVVVEPMFDAVGANNLLRFDQLIAGHGGKKMVLDLVIEPAVPEVDDRMGAHVARRQHLLFEKGQRVVLVDDGHALVVGSENRPEVEAEEGAVDQEENQRVERPQGKEQQPGENQDVEPDQEQFQIAILGVFILQKEDQAAKAQAGRGEGEDGKEKVTLVAHDKAGHPFRPAGLFFGKGQNRNVDIGIHVDFVGVGVVFVVLGDPVAKAFAEDEIADDQADDVVLGRRAKRLPVADVVRDKAELDEDEREENGVRDLQPEAVADKKERQTDEQHDGPGHDFSREVAGLLGEEPSLFDEPLQRGVVGPRPAGRGVNGDGSRVQIFKCGQRNLLLGALFGAR